MADQKITDEQRREIIRRFDAGASISQLASEYNVCTTTIWRKVGCLHPDERLRRQRLGGSKGGKQSQGAAGRKVALGVIAVKRRTQSKEDLHRRYMPFAETQSRLSLSRFTLHQYLTEGKVFPGAFRFGKEWLIPRAEVEAYAERRKPNPRSKAGG